MSKLTMLLKYEGCDHALVLAQLAEKQVLMRAAIGESASEVCGGCGKTCRVTVLAAAELDRLHALELKVKELRDQCERSADGFRKEALSYEDDHGNLPMRNAWKAGIAMGKASAREHCKEALDRALEAAPKGETR